MVTDALLTVMIGLALAVGVLVIAVLLRIRNRGQDGAPIASEPPAAVPAALDVIGGNDVATPPHGFPVPPPREAAENHPADR